MAEACANIADTGEGEGTAVVARHSGEHQCPCPYDDEEEEPEEQRHHIVLGSGVDGRLVHLHGNDGVGMEYALKLYAGGLDDDEHTDILETSGGGAAAASHEHQEHQQHAGGTEPLLIVVGEESAGAGYGDAVEHGGSDGALQ